LSLDQPNYASRHYASRPFVSPLPEQCSGGQPGAAVSTWLWWRDDRSGGANGAAELCSAWTGETPVPTRATEAAAILLVLPRRLLRLLRGFGLRTLTSDRRRAER